MGDVTSKANVIAAFAQYVVSKRIPFRHAVTLTLNSDDCDREYLDKNVSKFYNKLNDILSGTTNWVRLEKQGKYTRLRNVTVIEGKCSYKRLHVHCAIAFPKRINGWQAELLIKSCWEQTSLGKDARIDVRDIYDCDGWIKYISKEFAATGCDALDVKNTYLGKIRKVA